ncbi:DUF1003 domain-containing protein [Actinoallomurus sp. NPDC050550]|uniref:DUF1003 domain-containing protein n=1 Tax=Actinoallomurus sp. NPDC050550 TaxID=3154937 RepID=UPI0033F48160
MSTASQTTDVPQHPVTVSDEKVGFNSAIAAALTWCVGSMPALYVVLIIVTGWMALATWGPLHRVDPYPFGFLLFLNNVVQLVLCSVILVGQRVLGMAADRRAVQTYENAEAIFERVADLQAHLDRQDRALSRGVSLLESSPHPWIDRHRVQPPPQAIDQAVGINGRIAAWLTQRLGSMWAFYISAGTQVIWIALDVLGIQRFDPYPFAFMAFLSTLAQLIFMVVIMVGQDVLSRAADRRSEQTFLDAEAILHECRRMKARLTAQDRVIDSLADYTTAQVTEHLAQTIHKSRLQSATDTGEAPAGRPALHPWNELLEEIKEANRLQARQIGERLAAIGYLMVPAVDPALAIAFDEEEAESLAQLEHQQWLGEQRRQRPADPPEPDDGTRPDLVPWERLSDEARAQAVDEARRIPVLLADVGFQVLRNGKGTSDGPGELDFTPEEWATLEQALMASGVLVSLAEGVVDSEEIFALVTMLREASITHPRRFIRELAAASDFDTRLQAGTVYADYEGPALQAIRSASTIVARTAPAELDDFRAFLVEIATTVADANNEGGFFGLGARPRTPNEAAAIEAVKEATELDPSGQGRPGSTWTSASCESSS